VTDTETPEGVDCAPIDGYLTREPRRWTGFAPLAKQRVIACYPFADGEGAASIGEKPVGYRFHALPRPGFTSPFFFYFEDERLAFIATDFWSLDRAECDSVLSELGPPPHRLNAHFLHSEIPDGERVFPDRGLALCVVPETGLIVRWTAFEPCTLADYRERYRRVEPTREFEEGGPA
jgi:hypothetical protein